MFSPQNPSQKRARHLSKHSFERSTPYRSIRIRATTVKRQLRHPLLRPKQTVTSMPRSRAQLPNHNVRRNGAHPRHPLTIGIAMILASALAAPLLFGILPSHRAHWHVSRHLNTRRLLPFFRLYHLLAPKCPRLMTKTSFGGSPTPSAAICTRLAPPRTGLNLSTASP